MKPYSGKINIFHLIEGARQAEGLTVIIDVFRAFSLEAYLYGMGVKEIRPVGTIEQAFALHESIPGSVLIGERGGKKCEGFDFGNSPSTVIPERVNGRTVIHTTSAGTQGIVNAGKDNPAGVTEIITGSLANAKAVAAYIIAKAPETVSIVCMGNAGVRIALEDELCAEYIKSLLEGEPLPDIKERTESLRTNGGEHFFDPNNQHVFPKEDFELCIDYDKFPYVIKINTDEKGYITERIFTEC